MTKKAYSEDRLVTVIVPVYNTRGHFLDYCVESILGQSYQNIEIILVDDGSDDGTATLCDAYARHHSKIEVVHQNNQGASGARNTGMSYASGQYIMFVDSDDFISRTCIEILLKSIDSTGADIAIGQYETRRVELNATFLHTSRSTLVASEDAIELLLYGKCIPTGPVGKLIPTSVAKSTHFNTQYSFAEDLEFNFRLFKRVHNVTVASDKIYCYRQSIGSVTRSEISSKRMDGLYATEFIVETSNSETNTLIKNAAKYRSFMEAVFIGVKVSGHSKFKKEYVECCTVIKHYGMNVFCNSRVRIDNRILAFMTMINPSLAIYLYKLKIRIKKSIL